VCDQVVKVEDCRSVTTYDARLARMRIAESDGPSYRPAMGSPYLLLIARTEFTMLDASMVCLRFAKASNERNKNDDANRSHRLISFAFSCLVWLLDAHANWVRSCIGLLGKDHPTTPRTNAPTLRVSLM
jgi:hypothetical protein